WKRTLVSYYGLVAVEAVASGLGVYWLYQLTGFREVLIKVFVDAVLFMISYRIQNLLIFKNKEK
ncbi:MAG: glycosyl transferase, partial [Alkalibacterium sp.]